MTKKDFELIAATLKNARQGKAVTKESLLIDYLAIEFSERLKRTNKQFNASKFLIACGVTL